MTSTWEAGKVPTLPLIFPRQIPVSDFSMTDTMSPSPKLISMSFFSSYRLRAFATAMARLFMSDTCGGKR